jgi:hypothetical protein
MRRLLGGRRGRLCSKMRLGDLPSVQYYCSLRGRALSERAEHGIAKESQVAGIMAEDGSKSTGRVRVSHLHASVGN